MSVNTVIMHRNCYSLELKYVLNTINNISISENKEDYIQQLFKFKKCHQFLTQIGMTIIIIIEKLLVRRLTDKGHKFQRKGKTGPKPIRLFNIYHLQF